MTPEFKNELHRTFVLLGAKQDLQKVISNIGGVPSDEDILSGLEAWNNSKRVEINQIISGMNIEKHAKTKLKSCGIKTNYIGLNGIAPKNELLEEQVVRAILNTERKCWLSYKYPSVWRIFIFRRLWYFWCDVVSLVCSKVKYV